MQIAGVDQVITFAYGMGISPSLTPQAHNLSTAIGDSAVRMIDHTSAYAAFANGGHKVVARGILKVTDGGGTVLRDFTQAPSAGDVMTPAQAWSITAILRNYAKQWNLHFKYDTAGKSGTTNNFIDAWYMTYTPDWVVATWSGHTSNTTTAEQGTNGVFGTGTAGAIAVPFVNSLSKPSAFTPVSGSLPDCSQSDTGFANVSGCPTPTPSPTPSPTESASPSPSESPSPSGRPSASPSPSVSSPPSPTPTAAGPTAAPSVAPVNISSGAPVGEPRRRSV
jgi:penicillin-binding protein 1A